MLMALSVIYIFIVQLSRGRVMAKEGINGIHKYQRIWALTLVLRLPVFICREDMFFSHLVTFKDKIYVKIFQNV